MNHFVETNYINYLFNSIEENKHLRGYRARLAEAAKVHGSYISRVLKGDVHLTPDQAAQLCVFWKLSSDQTDYFINLVNLARAGAPELKNLLQKKLNELRQKNQDVSERVTTAKLIPQEAHGLYYSAWHYSALHMLLMLPGSHSAKTLSKRLELSEETIELALQTLAQIGVSKKVSSGWVVQEKDLHLPRSSPWTPIYHSTMRQRSAFRAFKPQADDLQFTALHSMSEKDYGIVKDVLLETIEKIRAVAAPSKEEDVFYISLDAFRI